MAYKEFLDKELGVVRLSMRRNSTRITGRWDNGKVLVIFPPGVDGATIERALEHMKPGLLAHRPVTMFEIGRSLLLDCGLRFDFVRHRMKGNVIEAVRAGDRFTVRIGESFDMASADASGRISRLLIRVAGEVAGPILIPEAEAIARSLSLRPRLFKISRGHKVLGHCSSGGEIALSAICIFLPAELREYIVCHELAHLTEMNHSARFHALCDRYLGGREAALISRLRTFPWPVER